MPSSRPQGYQAPAWSHRHELRDVNAPLIVLCAVVMVVGAIVMHFGLWWLMDIYQANPASRPQVVSPIARTPGPPPGPPLQVNPPADLQAVMAEENGHLAGYGWADRSRGRVRIPIDQAMADVAAHGEPSWPAPAASKQGAPGLGTILAVRRNAPKPAGLGTFYTRAFPREP